MRGNLPEEVTSGPPKKKEFGSSLMLARLEARDVVL